MFVIKGFDCRLTHDLVDLVQREVDLILREVPAYILKALRMRISTLVYQFCKNPVFNPEAGKLMKVSTYLQNEFLLK